MIQLYFLSVLCNGLAGYVLIFGDDSQGRLQFPVISPTFYLVLGILSAVTGVLKILSPVKVLFIGDLIPAAAGIVAGIILIFGIYRQNMSAGSGELDRLVSNMLVLRKPIGMGILTSALVHFIFAELIFL